jgi:hypothetical protein
MDNFSRKSLSKYLMKTVDFNKHEMTCGKNTLATIQNYKMISSPESSVFSKFSRCLPKHGIKMGGKNSTLSDIIKL